MLTIDLLQLTPEQIDLIPLYRRKWEKIARSTEEIDRERASLAIKNAYEFIDLPKPDIIFFSKPDEALNYIYDRANKNWGKLAKTSLSNPIARKFTKTLLGNLRNRIKGEILEQLGGKLDGGMADELALETANKLQENRLFSILWINRSEAARVIIDHFDVNNISKYVFNLPATTGFIINKYLFPPFCQMQKLFKKSSFNKFQPHINMNHIFAVLLTDSFVGNNLEKYRLPNVGFCSAAINIIVPSVMIDFAYYIDYCHEVLDFNIDEHKWNIFNDLITNCGWLFPYEKTVLICQRQTKL